jgi:hypothetical protein
VLVMYPFLHWSVGVVSNDAWPDGWICRDVGAVVSEQAERARVQQESESRTSERRDMG